MSGLGFRWDTIGGRIVLFGGAVCLPLLILSVWLAIQLAASNRHILERVRDDLATQASGRVDGGVIRVFGMLTGLAASGELTDRKFAQFSEQARLVLKSPSITGLWVFSSTNDIVAQVGLPPNDRLRGKLDDEYRKALQGQHAVSRVFGDDFRNATFVVVQPLTERAKSFGLAAEVRAEAFRDIFRDTALPPGWVAAVIDRHGHYVARSVDALRRTSQPARPELIRVAKSGERSGVFENVTYEGVRVVNAFYRSPLTGWVTIVAIPADKLNGPLNRNLMFVFFGSMLGLSAMLIAAILMSRLIAEPVRALAEYANTAAIGGAPRRPPRYHIAELDNVQEAFSAALGKGAHLSALVASSADAILSTDLKGKILTWNESAENLFGYSHDDMIGKYKTELVPPDKLEEYEQHRSRLLDGEQIQAETQRVARDGTVIDVSISLAPICRPDGRIVAISSVIRDIRRRRAMQDHVQILLREVAHRSKNQLALVLSIATQTARTTPDIETFLSKFQARIRSMAASTDLLLSGDWKGSSLLLVLETQLAPFDDSGARITLKGPEVHLDARGAEALSLAIHELATNALKYGALSVSSGRIDVCWSVSSNPGAPELLLEWREHGGPSVEAPKSRGFGTTVLERIVPTMLSGSAEVAFNDEGVRWILRAPIAQRWSVSAEPEAVT